MPKHLSARLNWHMNGWNGRIYQRPSSNTYCDAQSRGGAPMLVSHEVSASIEGEILVLEDTVSVHEARHMLWRRERRKEGTGETYVDGTSSNSVLVCDWTDFATSEPLENIQRMTADLNPQMVHFDGRVLVRQN